MLLRRLKMNYEDLKLGEKAKEAFVGGKSTEDCPVYLNTRPVIYGLNVTDLVIAGVLAGMNTLLIGNTGCGKSQLARDIHNYYFNGSKKNGGHGISMEGDPDLSLKNIITKIDMKKGERVPNGNHEALFWNLEEINRTPSMIQNQFYGVGNGRVIFEDGTSVPIGRDNYRSSIATANFGNGEFQGTFETDKALLNRFGIVIDFDYEMFEPTLEDRMLIKRLRDANPGIKESPLRDFADKILKAYRQISDIAIDPGLEALAVADYIQLGLRNCQGKTTSKDDKVEPTKKGKSWPIICQDCSKNKNGKYLCSLVREPQERTMQSMMRYASALHYLVKIKNPDQEIDPVELMFKAFELTAAYQHVLNPAVLRQEYIEQNPEMMRYVVNELKRDFRANQDFIMTSLSGAEEGRRDLDYFEHEGKVNLGYDRLNDNGKSEVTKINPFTDKRPVGLKWVNDSIDLNLKLNNKE